MFRFIFLLILIPILSGCTIMSYTGDDYDIMSVTKISTPYYTNMAGYSKPIDKDLYATIATTRIEGKKDALMLYIEILNRDKKTLEFDPKDLHFFQNGVEVKPLSKDEFERLLIIESTKIQRQLNIDMKDEIHTYQEVIVEMLKDELIRKTADIKSLNKYKKLIEEAQNNYMEGVKKVEPDKKVYMYGYLKHDLKYPLIIKYRGQSWQFSNTVDKIWNY